MLKLRRQNTTDFIGAYNRLEEVYKAAQRFGQGSYVIHNRLGQPFQYVLVDKDKDVLVRLPTGNWSIGRLGER